MIYYWSSVGSLLLVWGEGFGWTTHIPTRKRSDRRPLGERIMFKGTAQKGFFWDPRVILFERNWSFGQSLPTGPVVVFEDGFS